MIDYYKISILIILPEIQYTNGKNKDKGKFINKNCLYYVEIAILQRYQKDSFYKFYHSLSNLHFIMNLNRCS